MNSAVERHETVVSVPVLFREGMEREKILAISRLVISLICLVALSSLETSSHPVARLIPFLYVLHSLAIVIVVFVGRPLHASFVVLVHAFDVIWPSLIFLLSGQAFLLFAFALVAAAYRWRARQTLLTAAATALSLSAACLFGYSSLSLRLRLPKEPLRADTLAVWILGLLVLAGLLGFLADQERREDDASATAKSILDNLHPEAGIEENLQDVLSAFVRTFDASRIVLLLKDLATGRVAEWQVRRSGARRGLQQRRRRLPSIEADPYLQEISGNSWSLRSNPGPGAELIVLNRQGRRLKANSCPFPADNPWDEPFGTLWAADLQVGKQWMGRVFLLKGSCSSDRESSLRFFQRLVEELTPAVYNTYLWWRVRTRARAIERKRIARDLHDGVIQTLIAMQLDLDTLRRQNEGRGFAAADAVAKIQTLIHQEVRKLREEIEQLGSDSPRPSLRTSLTDIVEAFQHETGIAATLVCDVRADTLPSHIARELANIVHEALCNVRKHSGAHKVEVRVASKRDSWRVVIQDDGHGFDFTGRLSESQLRATHKGPRVIQERVHSVNGELAIESYPDRGARLEISLACHS
jgi:signal transduction histidine kinase